MASKTHYALGIDYGTASVRTLVVDLSTGQEVAQSVWNYAHGKEGVLVDARDPHLARQHPQDYIDGLLITIRGALAAARKAVPGFSAERIIGIGVDTTGSTPIPVDADNLPLGLTKKFSGNLNAMAWLWKDHTGVAEAVEITETCRRKGLPYITPCGGTYSSEWYWSKLLHCLRKDPAVFKAAASWVELADWVPAFLCGIRDPRDIKRGICAAGHKALYSDDWGGWPSAGFLKSLHPRLADALASLPSEIHKAGDRMGNLDASIADKVGLSRDTVVSVGAFDAHLGAVGGNVGPGKFVKIIGTSTCDVTVTPLHAKRPRIPGVCGVVRESVLPGAWGIEAGQSAVGDIFYWYASHIDAKKFGPLMVQLTREASRLRPGQSGLLALDWHNGNRTVLVDQRLTGLTLGNTLGTGMAEEFRALIEATGFGARVILERIEAYGSRIREVIAIGGIAEKNPLLMQIYADIMKRPIRLVTSSQTCAFGSAIAGAVAAGPAAGGFATFEQAQKKLIRYRSRSYRPRPAASRIYDRLFRLYRRVHDSFGVPGTRLELYPVMKELLEIKKSVTK